MPLMTKDSEIKVTRRHILTHFRLTFHQKPPTVLCLVHWPMVQKGFKEISLELQRFIL